MGLTTYILIAIGWFFAAMMVRKNSDHPKIRAAALGNMFLVPFWFLLIPYDIIVFLSISLEDRKLGGRSDAEKKNIKAQRDERARAAGLQKYEAKRAAMTPQERTEHDRIMNMSEEERRADIRYDDSEDVLHNYKMRQNMPSWIRTKEDYYMYAWGTSDWSPSEILLDVLHELKNEKKDFGYSISHYDKNTLRIFNTSAFNGQPNPPVKGATMSINALYALGRRAINHDENNGGIAAGTCHFEMKKYLSKEFDKLTKRGPGVYKITPLGKN